MYQLMLSPTLQDSPLYWVVHHAHALAASIRLLSPKSASVIIHVYSFVHNVISRSEAGELVKCKEYQLVTGCTCQPFIMSFGLVPSGPEAL